MVQLAVAPHGEPVELLRAGGDLYRGSTVVRGEVVFIGGPADVAGHAEGDGGHDRAHPEDFGRGGAGRGHDGLQASLHLGELGVEAAEVGQELPGELLPCIGDRAGGLQLLEEPLDLVGVDLVKGLRPEGW